MVSFRGFALSTNNAHERIRHERRASCFSHFAAAAVFIICHRQRAPECALCRTETQTIRSYFRWCVIDAYSVWLPFACAAIRQPRLHSAAAIVPTLYILHFKLKSLVGASFQRSMQEKKRRHTPHQFELKRQMQFVESTKCDSMR